MNKVIHRAWNARRGVWIFYEDWPDNYEPEMINDEDLRKLNIHLE